MYCLNLVNWLSAYLRDLSLVRLHFASTRFLLAQFYDITKSSTISMLMILSYIVRLILILQTKFSDIRTWMIRNNLKINDDKTEFLFITSSRAKFTENIDLSIGKENISSSNSCKSLGVMLDSHFSMDTQINSLCKATYFHLRNISAIGNHLSSATTEQLIHSLVSSRLDYCNSLLYCVPKYKIKYLQRVQNVAARIVTRCPRRDHITPHLESLHWLPVEFRIVFKILLLAYKYMNNLAPNYLSELVTPYTQERYPTKAKFEHRFNNSPIFKLKSYGERSFTFAAPTEWNKLPLEIKTTSSVESFKSKLKTYLFARYFG